MVEVIGMLRLRLWYVGCCREWMVEVSIRGVWCMVGVKWVWKGFRGIVGKVGCVLGLGW